MLRKRRGHEEECVPEASAVEADNAAHELEMDNRTLA
jgi:hypothetical protein